eukprot:673289-Rhodomonas_salina.1
MAGTCIAYGTVRLRARYAMRSTDLAYGAVSLRARYAECGTDLAYGTHSGTQPTTSQPTTRLLWSLLSAYAPAMRPRTASAERKRSALSRENKGFPGTRRTDPLGNGFDFAQGGGEEGGDGSSHTRPLTRGVATRLCSYALPTRCAVLTYRQAATI